MSTTRLSFSGGYLGPIQTSYDEFSYKSDFIMFVSPLDTGRKLNVYKTFRRCPARKYDRPDLNNTSRLKYTTGSGFQFTPMLLIIVHGKIHRFQEYMGLLYTENIKQYFNYASS